MKLLDSLKKMINGFALSRNSSLIYRELGGIPKLVRLLSSDVPDIQKNVCGCLKNLSFGKENDENKVSLFSRK